METFYRASIEYVKVPIARTDGADITTDPVALALLADLDTEPGLSDLLTADWVTESGTTKARTLVDFSTMAAGVYGVWVKVTHSPEVMARLSGFIRVV